MTAPAQRRPNVFLIGAPKSGTSALATFLAEHPNVVMSRPKEPMYWCADLPSGAHELRPQSLEDYLDLFDSSGTVDAETTHVGEGSTKYLRSAVAVRNILEFNPDARFIAMIRNPIEVAQAFHMEQRYQGQEPQADFMTAWREQPAREVAYDATAGDGTLSEEVLYRRVVDFPTQLRRLADTVSSEQYLVILYDDFRADPLEVWRRMLGFLGLPDDGRSEFPRVNAAHQQRFPRLSRWLLHPPGPLQAPMRSIRRRLIDRPNVAVEKVKALMNVERRRSDLSAAHLAELQAYFQPQIDELVEMLGADLTHWYAAPV